MMLDRNKISFWTKIGAITLAVIFVGSFLFVGIGTGLNYSLLDLLSGSGKQEEQKTGSEEQIAKAEKDLEGDPENPKVLKRLGALYLQEGQTDKAAEVLEKGRKADPQDPVFPLYLGQANEKKAQGLPDEEKRKAAYKEAGDAYAAAAEAQKNKPQPYLLAGQAYEQAGEKGKAIQYWNEYLKLEPEGEQADAVKERIGALLKGGETTGSAGGAKR
ncbi:MAG TPA: tetratricopeptide repeat protein [Rubrobacteraceae bacterium]|nr:tetratricopeptide repeat protein [Rubrobacteraceae bacterium]